jgi:hypothetical protein
LVSLRQCRDRQQLFGTAGRVGGRPGPEEAWYMACVAVVVIPGRMRQLEVSLSPRGNGG